MASQETPTRYNGDSTERYSGERGQAMISVRGTFRNGCAQPDEAVEGHEGQPVIITFVENEGQARDGKAIETDYDALIQLLEDCRMDTGIEDLAHQHDHYLHGTPKKTDYSG
jgi:hypothetical protein